MLIEASRSSDETDSNVVSMSTKKALTFESEIFISSHNILKICSQNHCALQFVRLEEQHGHN